MHAEHHADQPMNRWRAAAWGAAACLLLVPLIAMQFTEEVDWTASDFVFAAVTMFGLLGIYELVARKTGSILYRAAAGLALVTTFLLVWINGAVGITDSEADLLFFLGVPAVTIIGSLVARFRPRGMAHAMFATAFVLVAVGVGALVAGLVPAFNSAFEVMALTGFFAALFVGAGMLFQWAADDGQSEQDAV